MTSFVFDTNTTQQWRTSRWWYSCCLVYAFLSDSGSMVLVFALSFALLLGCRCLWKRTICCKKPGKYSWGSQTWRRCANRSLLILCNPKQCWPVVRMLNRPALKRTTVVGKCLAQLVLVKKKKGNHLRCNLLVKELELRYWKQKCTHSLRFIKVVF